MATPYMKDRDDVGTSHGTTLSPRSEGIELPIRRLSVTLHRRISESEDTGKTGGGRESLDGTRSFYNVQPNSPPSHPSQPSTRLSFRSPSHQSADLPQPNSMPQSPPRMNVPLPTPRAFLSPKKPVAAIRLEQQSSNGRSSLTRQAETPSITTAPLRQAHQSNDFGMSPEPMSLDAMLASGPAEDPYVPRSRTAHSLGQSLTDISTPPRIHRELSSDNLVNTLNSEKTLNPHPPRRGGGRIKRYQRLGNPQTTWFLGGRAMTGGDAPWSILMTLIIILGLTGVWIGTTGVWLWQSGSQYGLGKGGGIAIVIVLVYLFGIVISSFAAAALRDPGIIPRNLDPEPPLSQVESWWEPDNREMIVKNGKVVVKYCETCKTYRPPRASHCRLCGNCVDGIDHHCSYLHTCVGKRNYLAFLTLLISGTISAIYVVVFSAIHFALLCHYDDMSFGSALRDSPGAAVSFLLGVLVLPAISFLLWYHVRLLLFNLTTVEQIRASASSNWFSACKRPENPFAGDSLRTNALMASLGRPQFPSWIDATSWHEEDTREINPALTDPKRALQG